MSDQIYHPYYAGSQALVIGINSYSDARLVPLGQAEADAIAVADALASDPYDFLVETLLGPAATKQAVLQALFRLRSSGPDDRVLIYFAGHGYTLADRFHNETGYLAVVDTVPEQDFTALALDEVTGLRRHAEAKHITFVFDACFSGQALGLTRAPSVAAEKFLERRAYQVVSAGAGDQTVSDARSMTRYLLEGLRSTSSGEQGLYTISKLGLYVQGAMAAESGQMQIPQFGHLQGSQGGDFVLWMDMRPRLPRGIDTALGSGWSNIRLGVVAELATLTQNDDPGKVRLAHERLVYLAEKDPDERVRSAARMVLEPQLAGPVTSPAAPLTEMVLCAACSTENPAHARRCMNCGLALGKTCTACGRINAAGAERCAACDTPLDMLASIAARKGDEKVKGDASRAKLVASQKAEDMAFMDRHRQAFQEEERARVEKIATNKQDSQRQLTAMAAVVGAVLLVALIVVIVSALSSLPR